MENEKTEKTEENEIVGESEDVPDEEYKERLFTILDLVKDGYGMSPSQAMGFFGDMLIIIALMHSKPREAGKLIAEMIVENVNDAAVLNEIGRKN